MEYNDRIISDNSAHLKLLIDSSAFISFKNIEAEAGTNPLQLIDKNPNIDYFFAVAMINELIKGREGFNFETQSMFKKALHDETSSTDDKESRHLYTDKDGNIKFANLTKISVVDYGQILLCQNHTNLVLLTDDHRMQKNSGALLDRRLMDTLNLLELMAEVPDKKFQQKWQCLLEWFRDSSGYKRPKTVRFIEDRKPGELPAHLKK